ncbi:MAG: efflux RND transporter permease subunit [Chloroflexi bacterium]|nr:efflux RND transporter permease subunit [Chloroflexota bacterium]
MPLAKLAIRQPIFISMVLLAFTLLGILSYRGMGVDLLPDISSPVVSVTVSFPGATPEEVETLVTKPVEAAISTLNGIESVSSSSREGSARVTISFRTGHNMQQASQEVRERLDTIKRRLPDGADEPVLRRFDPNDAPFMTATLTTRGEAIPPNELRRMMEELVAPRLERLPGVAAVDVSGLSVQEVQVDLIASKLRTIGVSPQQVLAALRAENVVMPSGRVSGARENLLLRTSAEFRNLDEIRDIVVARRGTRAVLLGEVASVQVAFRERNSLVRFNGQETLVLDMRKQSESNIVQAAHLVREELGRISRDFPQLAFAAIRDDSTFIEEADRDVTVTLIIGALLAASIVLLFFRNMRNTLITVAGLPVIVISTFSVMSLLGYTRNVISLMALSLSIGLLIDDAIVVRENIFRHMERGASPRRAAEEATGEIAFAVLAITLTIVAVFIPVAFTTGTVGVLFKEFGIVVSVAVLVSLVEAFTLAPLLSAYFGKPLKKAHGNAAEKPLPDQRVLREGAWAAISGGYRRVLGWSLRHRWLVVGAALASFVASIWLVRTLPVGFFPTSDPGALTVGIRQPPGTPLEKSDQVAREVERFAMAQPEVKQVLARVNADGGSLSVQLREGVATGPMIARFRGGLSQYGRTITITQPRQFLGVGGGFGGAQVGSRPVLVAVRGPVGLDTLDDVADQVTERLHTVPGLRDIDKSLPPREPELHVSVDRQRAAHNGISAATVGQTIRTLVQGTTATDVNWQDQRMDVTVQLRKEDRSDAAALMNIPLSGPGGELLPLQTVARIERASGPAVLDRQERQRQILVGANLEGRSQGAVMPEVRQALAGVSLPPGVTWRFAGQQAQTETAFGSLAFALALGLIFVYMVLASQFASFIHPLTIMVALPLSAVGAVGALVIARLDLTVIAMIGIILLMGLVTKNSILLVDFIIRYRKEGQSRTEAVIAAGPVRLRPILMTTLAIVLGMAPTALGIGAAGEFRAPMAIAAIGGVFSSTILSLVVVPVAYTLMDDIVVLVLRLAHWRPRAAARSKAVTPGLMGTGPSPDPGDKAA